MFRIGARHAVLFALFELRSGHAPDQLELRFPEEQSSQTEGAATALEPNPDPVIEIVALCEADPCTPLTTGAAKTEDTAATRGRGNKMAKRFITQIPSRMFSSSGETNCKSVSTLPAHTTLACSNSIWRDAGCRDCRLTESLDVPWRIAIILPHRTTRYHWQPRYLSETTDRRLCDPASRRVSRFQSQQVCESGPTGNKQ